MQQHEPTESLRQRWSQARPTKTAFFWSCVASAILTMIIGFTWGGWVRGATAQSMGQGMAEDAVVKHLAPICVAQFKEDPARDQKLKALKGMSSYEQGDYVKKQGWAKMPGESEVNDRVADECARLIGQ